MTDPLAEVVTLLQPRANFPKSSAAPGRGASGALKFGQPFFASCWKAHAAWPWTATQPHRLAADDFVLIPGRVRLHDVQPDRRHLGHDDTTPLPLPQGEIRHGTPDVPAEVRLLVGHCEFGSPDAALLVSLLPQLVHVRGERRLATLVQLVGDESRAQRPGARSSCRTYWRCC
jgi:hypothetical protein